MYFCYSNTATHPFQEVAAFVFAGVLLFGYAHFPAVFLDLLHCQPLGFFVFPEAVVNFRHVLDLFGFVACPQAFGVSVSKAEIILAIGL